MDVAVFGQFQQELRELPLNSGALEEMVVDSVLGTGAITILVLAVECTQVEQSTLYLVASIQSVLVAFILVVLMSVLDVKVVLPMLTVIT